MTEKQKRFCEEYLIDLNASQAAIRAGYSARSAHSIATENMQKPAVRARIDEALATRSKRTGVNADRVVRELARVAFVNPTDVIDMESATLKDDATEDDTAAVASVKVKTIPTADGQGMEREIKMADKLKALELLGKHLGMFTDKVEHSGAIDTGSAALTSILQQLQAGGDPDREEVAPPGESG
ncbi:terminase small subunit [Faecalispora anaeroviscerum]|uniref:terminase small subunit n=1 Tax=Faecalispora anaeroviscerum TaxID=2991836 RepID=UPI0024BABEE1|nr:terminase small subunit [Faecalispora anaeroviscerum]